MKILVVEDEHRIAQTIKKGLEQERYAIDVAYRGDEGYDLALVEDYDLILLDVMLPAMDGVQLCRNLRKKNIHTPILMLTAKGQIEDKIEGLDAGADDYLAKPFSFEELLARIRALSRRPHKALTDRLKVENLSLDRTTYEVERAGQTVLLSGKEFALLEYLMRNAHKILTKEQIISHVWNYDANILPNTVEVYIRNLRNKIDKPFKDEIPLVNTVRGFGYKIGK
jgi:two-component system, OmpR family, response regulator